MCGTSTRQRVPAPCGQGSQYGCMEGRACSTQGLCPWERGEAREGDGRVQSDRPRCSSPCTLCPQECQMPPAASTSLWPAAPRCR